MCQNNNVTECSRVPKVQDIDNILRKMCQSHYFTISPPGLIFWEMFSNASPLTSCNRNTLFLLLLALSSKQKVSLSVPCNRIHYFSPYTNKPHKLNFHSCKRNTLLLLLLKYIAQTKLSLSITWIWWWRWPPWPPGRPSPSSRTRCCSASASPLSCQGTCRRVLEMSNTSSGE